MTLENVPAPRAWGEHAPGPVLSALISASRAMPTNRLGKKAAFGFRNLGMRLVSGPVDIEVYGCRARMDPRGNLAGKRLVFTPQFFDLHERRALAEHIAATSGPFTFIDIGANVGGWTLFAAGLLGDRGRLIAVEPQPGIAEALAYNIALNPQARIDHVPHALLDRDGFVEMFIAEANRGQSSLAAISGAPTVRIEGRTLLGVLGDLGVDRVNALKIDIEGAEELVIPPFLAEAPTALLPDLVVMEDSPRRWTIDLVAIFRDRGYSVEKRGRQNLILRRG